MSLDDPEKCMKLLGEIVLGGLIADAGRCDACTLALATI